MRGMKTVIAVAASALSLLPAAARGQDVPPRLSVAAGVGIANPLHADFDFTAREWHLSTRASMSSHLAIEGFYDDWEHAEDDVLLNQAIQGPTGFLGRVERVELVTTHRMRTLGVNVVATGGSSRVTFSGGGGIGVLAYNRRFKTSATGCDAAVAHVCGATENRFSSGDFTAQGVAEVDVAVARCVQLFARSLIVVAVSDPGFGHSSLGGGVRVVLF
jgi:hypothetical protein